MDRTSWYHSASRTWLEFLHLSFGPMDIEVEVTSANFMGLVFFTRQDTHAHS